MHVPHWKGLKHFIHVQYGCEIQSKVVYSLGSTSTGSVPSGNRSVTRSVTSTQKMWTLAAPQVRKWSFFFNQTFRISYWHLLEQIETLRGGIGAIWKKHIFYSGPPTFQGRRSTRQCCPPTPGVSTLLARLGLQSTLTMSSLRTTNGSTAGQATAILSSNGKKLELTF